MMRAREDFLARAEQHVVDCERILSRQEMLIDRMIAWGQDRDEAERVLARSRTILRQAHDRLRQAHEIRGGS